MSKVVIVDYGLGNLFSIDRVLRHLGAAPFISSDPQEVASAPKLILPGVGAFGDGMKNLCAGGLDDAIRDFVKTGRPLLGICLGMQLLLDESEEFGLHRGLGIIPGRVIRLAGVGDGAVMAKIPHVGWNTLLPPNAEGWKGSILNDLGADPYVYFVHSYRVVTVDKRAVLAETVYGENRFCSALRQNNVSACQFHPEISGEVGLKILRNFLHNDRSS